MPLEFRIKNDRWFHHLQRIDAQNERVRTVLTDPTSPNNAAFRLRRGPGFAQLRFRVTRRGHLDASSFMTVRGGHLAGTRKPHSPAYSVSAAGTSVLLVVAEWDTAGRFVTRYHVVWSGKVAGSVLTTTDCLRWDGPFGSTVIEVDLENFGDWEGRFRAPMERPWMGESSCRMMPLVESDRREFDTVDEEPVV